MVTKTLLKTAVPERDFLGYGESPPDAHWPRGARLAVQFVLNYEEGGENCVLDGDAGSETFLSELFSPPSFPERHLTMESIYEYGSRVGVWRVLQIFQEFQWPLTIFAVGLALEKNPDVARAFHKLGHEVAGHGYRWIHYQNIEEIVERDHIAKCIDTITQLTGNPPKGWYTGRDSPNTRRLIADTKTFLYQSDYYGDDLPFYMKVKTSSGEIINQLIVPYTLDNNDMRFSLPQGFTHGEDFFQYLQDDAESLKTPRMMSIGLHGRLIGRPGRFMGLRKFLDYISKKSDIWVCRRDEIAQHWLNLHSPTDR
ncbi:MAG: allantoinase [Betaproteobacteria bacterium]|nr:allantoinase [Betaproteobacteria bacterium]